MRKTPFYILFTLTILYSVIGQGQTSVSPDDLKLVLGEWEGSLTYMDYSSKKPYSMPANATIEQGKNSYQLNLYYRYPNEPQANSKGKIVLSKDGGKLNGSEVLSNELQPNGHRKIITESQGRDDNQKALIRNIYILGPEQLIIRKEVKFENSEDWLQRNEFSFER